MPHLRVCTKKTATHTKAIIFLKLQAKKQHKITPSPRAVRPLVCCSLCATGCKTISTTISSHTQCFITHIGTVINLSESSPIHAPQPAINHHNSQRTCFVLGWCAASTKALPHVPVLLSQLCTQASSIAISRASAPDRLLGPQLSRSRRKQEPPILVIHARTERILYFH